MEQMFKAEIVSLKDDLNALKANLEGQDADNKQDILADTAAARDALKRKIYLIDVC